MNLIFVWVNLLQCFANTRNFYQNLTYDWCFHFYLACYAYNEFYYLCNNRKIPTEKLLYLFRLMYEFMFAYVTFIYNGKWHIVEIYAFVEEKYNNIRLLDFDLRLGKLITSEKHSNYKYSKLNSWFFILCLCVYVCAVCDKSYQLLLSFF